VPRREPTLPLVLPTVTTGSHNRKAFERGTCVFRPQTSSLRTILKKKKNCCQAGSSGNHLLRKSVQRSQGLAARESMRRHRIALWLYKPLPGLRPGESYEVSQGDQQG
jgi:hypothetical protein